MFYMSQGIRDRDLPSEEELRDSVEVFLLAQFPQIKMHGGEIDITEASPADEFVSINLEGACSGCGISPQTVQAIKRRLPKEVPEVTTVDVDTGDSDVGPSLDSESSPF